MLHFENQKFLNKLSKQAGKDVILFCADSMSYYGNLKSINEKNTVALVPALLSSTGLVEISNPAEVEAVENRSSINACTIVGFGFDITADPFVIPNDDAEDVATESTVTETPDDMIIDLTDTANDVDDNKNLYEKLDSQSGNLITIAAFGGFLLSGTLKNINKDTAELVVEYIFAPGGDGNTLFSINQAVVNLQAATSVSS
jgi:hypothetical protein